MRDTALATPWLTHDRPISSSWLHRTSNSLNYFAESNRGRHCCTVPLRSGPMHAELAQHKHLFTAFVIGS